MGCPLGHIIIKEYDTEYMNASLFCEAFVVLPVGSAIRLLHLKRVY